MKKLKLIYNPYSGNKNFMQELDTCITEFQSGGYEVHLFRSIERDDISLHIGNMPKDYYDAVAVSGGDGTLNIAVNALIKNDFYIPVGIIPSGTANDFATFLKIPKETRAACKVITEGTTVKSDIGLVVRTADCSPMQPGLVNGDYFINVCAAGFFSNISQVVDPDVKNMLGKLAYYLKGIEQLSNFNSFPVRIKNSAEIIEEDLLLFIILNSAGTGGFTKLSGYASINDGKFDFLGFKSMPVKDLAVLFLKLLRGEHLNDDRVIYFQDGYIEVENLSDIFGETDLDGEIGPPMPIKVANINKRLEFFCPCEEEPN